MIFFFSSSEHFIVPLILKAEHTKCHKNGKKPFGNNEKDS